MTNSNVSQKIIDLPAVERFGEYIKMEVLANSLTLAESGEWEMVELDDETPLGAAVILSLP